MWQAWCSISSRCSSSSYNLQRLQQQQQQVTLQAVQKQAAAAVLQPQLLA
jgi:hypothetical protein